MVKAKSTCLTENASLGGLCKVNSNKKNLGVLFVC